MGEKDEHNLRFMMNGKEIMRVSELDATFSQEDINEPQHIFEGFTIDADIHFSIMKILSILGINITNNALKMHGLPMRRRVAGRKGVRK